MHPAVLLVLQIVDHCPSCSHGDLDFSTQGLLDITGFKWDRKNIAWEWVDCGNRSGRRVST